MSVILMDNGSNMVAVFKAKFGEEEDNEVEEVGMLVAEDEQVFLDCEVEHNVEFGSLN